jgi:hypothetical protein
VGSLKLVSDEVIDEQIVQQMRVMVEAELQRRGWPGKPRVEGLFLVVGKGDREARVDLRGSLQQWDSLPDDLRQRRVQQIAKLLSEGAERASVRSRPPRQRRSNGPGLFSFVAPLLVLALTAGAIVVGYRLLAPNGNSPSATVNRWLQGAIRASASASASATAPSYNARSIEQERAVIASAACGNSRTRVARGGNVGPADVEGWQVELVLLRRGPAVDLSQSAALSPFVQRSAGSATGKLVWPQAKSIVAEERFDAQVELHALPPLGEKNVSGLSLVFSGPYVTPYFTEDQRVDYFSLADAMADAMAATDGALFAHCTNNDAHHVGAWFLGMTPGAAVASMIYFMEAFTDLPVLKPELLGSGSSAQARRGHTFDAINLATAGLSRSSVATLVGSELGMISGRPNKPARLTFPFRDGNRASRSGLAAARSVGLASSR